MQDIQFSETDLEQLRGAKKLLERPSLTAKLATAAGAPIEKVLNYLPAKVRQGLHSATQKSLQAAYETALQTFPPREIGWAPQNAKHRWSVIATGGISGFLGPWTMLAELPISTTLMMRSIMDVAQSEGHDINDPHVKLACLEVFALGGPSPEDDGAGSGYFYTRALFGRGFTKASRLLLTHGTAGVASPIVSKFLSQIASRFEILLTEKVATQMVPVLGAVGGAGINALFMDHFQQTARGHFIMRRLEKKYGEEKIKTSYESLPI